MLNNNLAKAAVYICKNKLKQDFSLHPTLQSNFSKCDFPESVFAIHTRIYS